MEPWIEPVELDAATPEQRDALKITPSSRPVGAYSLVLAHDPEALNQRSPLYNAIMFGPRGLPRADRELGAVVSSRINGCAYCASVHAKRFVDLTKEPEVMARIQADGVEAALDPRRQAIVDYAAKLTRDPAAVGAGDVAPLRAQGPERPRNPRPHPRGRDVRLGQSADADAGRAHLGAKPVIDAPAVDRAVN